LLDLDSASIRRFNHKIKLQYLTPQGNVAFYHKLLASLVEAALDPQTLEALRVIPDLAPGDFKVVRDRYSFYPGHEVNHGVLVQALREEAKIKAFQKGKKEVGF
jgi:hypothetical protein